jgi:hypothetical protein
MADLLYEKQQKDLSKKKNMVADISNFEQKRKALEMGQKMMKHALQRANPQQVPPTRQQTAALR